MRVWLLIGFAVLLPAQTIEVNRLWTAAPVAGVWRYIAGDDPSYADPAFDDSSWTSITLPGDGPKLPFGASWMRARVRLTGVRPPEPLALLVPLVGSSYEVYVDGKRIGEFGEGRFGHIPLVRVFRIDVSADEFTLAIRDRASLRAAALLSAFATRFVSVRAQY